jgi:Copper binding proteins, plastocyanin/azurin family
MTDTTTVDEEKTGTDDQLPELAESPALGVTGADPNDPLKARFLLPLLLPLLSIAAVAVYAINISRVLLAGDENSALVIGIVLTLSILIGATIIAAAPRLRTSSLAMVLGLVIVIVVGAGLIALGPSLDDGTGGTATGYVVPTKPPVGTVAVTAGPGLTFNGIASTGNYDAPAGVVKIDYGGAAGHTLAIQDPKFDGFLLGTGAGTKHTGNAELTPGTYTIYCTVPGHEAAGMKATITVAAK